MSQESSDSDLSDVVKEDLETPRMEEMFGDDNDVFSAEEDEWLMAVFQQESMRPDVTPFPANMPPSGFTTQVSRAAPARFQKVHGQPWSHSMGRTNRRIRELCRRQRQAAHGSTFQTSTSSTNAYPLLLKLAQQENQSTASSTINNGMKSPFVLSSVDYFKSY